MNTFLIIIHVVVCLSIIIVVLLQVGRGAELGAAFGSMGQANSSRGAATFVGKFTTAMAVAFMVTSFFLTYITAENAKTSVIDKVSTEQTETTAPAATETDATEASEEAAE